MVTFDAMYEAMLSTRKNKRRSQDSVEFEIHWESKLLNLIKDINTRSVRPTAYTFVTEENSREVFACEFGMRIIHHYIDRRLRPILESKLSNYTYNNRVGFGPVQAIDQVIRNVEKVSKNYTTDAYIIQWDIKGYFPNAIQDIVYMIQISVFSYPTHHCYRKSPVHFWEKIPEYKSLFSKPDGMGGAIGHLIWQNAMNYYLNDLDHWIVGDLGLDYVRFVDDSVVVVQNKEAALPFLMPQVGQKMLEFGVTLHPKKFYCQHYTEGFKFIGTVIRPNRTHLNARVTWHAYNKIQKLNTEVRPEKVEHCLCSLNSYTGLFKNRNGVNLIKDLDKHLNPQWKKYIHMDLNRLCYNANPGYAHNDFLVKNYGLKLKKKSHKQKKKPNYYVQYKELLNNIHDDETKTNYRGTL